MGVYAIVGMSLSEFSKDVHVNQFIYYGTCIIFTMIAHEI